MKHLIDSIESNKLNLSTSPSETKQLLTNVRDSRESKGPEGFNEALEKVIAELRSTEHALPFLRAVRRSEAPGYDAIIRHPMDLTTMQRKVKNHAYKTRWDFERDLNLIWDNCLTYNSDKNHPLRTTAAFMRKKAEQAVLRLLGSSDKAPPIVLHMSNGSSSATRPGHHFAPPGSHSAKDLSRPTEASSSPKIRLKLGPTKPKPTNGTFPIPPHVSAPHSPAMNGSSLDHSTQPTLSTQTTPAPIAKSARPSRSASVAPPLEFKDSPAIVRTPQSMAHYRSLDLGMQRYLETEGAGPSRQPMWGSTYFMDAHPPGYDGGEAELRKQLKDVLVDENGLCEDTSAGVERILGGPKTKRYSRDDSPSGRNSHKRPRTGSYSPSTSSSDDNSLLGSWWAAVNSTSMIGSGLPCLPEPTLADMESEGFNPMTQNRKRKRRLKSSSTPFAFGSPSKKRKLSSTTYEDLSLKGIVYKNVNTLRRIRHTHTLLRAAASSTGPVFVPPSIPPVRLIPILRHTNSKSRYQKISLEGGAGAAASKLKADCATLVEHAGFEGTQSAALDVVRDLAAEFIMNVGRTLRFLVDTKGAKMSAEEIILHTLFESGTTKVQQLERYIKDDVMKYGGRLTELERKLDAVYNDHLDAEADLPEDEELFAEDGDALMGGDFANALGDDFFGFKELGIADEMNLSSLSVPQRLLRGQKKKENASGEGGAKKEPALRYPPPPPFVPLNSSTVDSQIGLLRGFYNSRIQALRPPPAPIPLLAAPTDGIPIPPVPAPAPPPFPAPGDPPVSLPDDPPNPLRIKMGPLGQITVISTTPVAPKKKAAAAKDKGTPALKRPVNTSQEGSANVVPAAATNITLQIAMIGTPPLANGVPNGDIQGAPGAPKKKKKYMKKEKDPGNAKGKGNGGAQGTGGSGVVNIAPQPALMVS